MRTTFVLIAAILTGYVLSSVFRPRSLTPLAPGVYERADSKATSPYVTDHNISVGETGCRVMVEPGFMVQYISGGQFIVRKAPKGYTDTIGRVFNANPLHCANYSD